jgi:hypothetical protein
MRRLHFLLFGKCEAVNLLRMSHFRLRRLMGQLCCFLMNGLFRLFFEAKWLADRLWLRTGFLQLTGVL